MKPCDMPCPKCGGADIFREHLEKDEERDRRWDGKGEWENEFVSYSFRCAKAKQECIAHHCRTCQYDWGTRVAEPGELDEA